MILPFYFFVALVVFEYFVGVIVVLLMAPNLAVIQDMGTVQQLAVSMLAGVMMVARSPSAVIAVCAEMKASGRYTNIIVGVTIMCDAVVILFYNLNDLVAGFLLSDPSKQKSPLNVIAEFFAQIIISTLGGLVFGLLMIVCVFWPKPSG